MISSTLVIFRDQLNRVGAEMGFFFSIQIKMLSNSTIEVEISHADTVWILVKNTHPHI